MQASHSALGLACEVLNVVRTPKACGGCAVCIYLSDCTTQSRCQEDIQQEDREVLLPGPQVFQGCLLVCGSPVLSGGQEQCALRKPHGDK